MEQVRVCTEIGIEFLELDRKRRPAACHIVDRLDATKSIVETGTSCSSIKQLMEPHNSREKIENIFAAKIEEAIQHLMAVEDYQCQDKG